MGLPPLVGFLVAGFSLNYVDAEGGEFLNEMADLGIALLLFSIGLKLKLKDFLLVYKWIKNTHRKFQVITSLSFLFCLVCDFKSVSPSSLICGVSEPSDIFDDFEFFRGIFSSLISFFIFLFGGGFILYVMLSRPFFLLGRPLNIGTTKLKDECF